MRAANYELAAGPQYFAFLSEFLTFLTLGADRIAHARGDEAWRVAFTTAMANRVGEILAENESSLLGAATPADIKRRFIDAGQRRARRSAPASTGPDDGAELRLPALPRPSRRRRDGRARPDLGDLAGDRGRGARGRRDAAPRDGRPARRHAAIAERGARVQPPASDAPRRRGDAGAGGAPGPFDLGAERRLRRVARGEARAPIRPRAADLVVPVRDPRALTPAEHAALADALPAREHGGLRERGGGRRQGAAARARRAVRPARSSTATGSPTTTASAASRSRAEAAAATTSRTRTGRSAGTPTATTTRPSGGSARWSCTACAPAASGGENALLDHEIAYLLLRDADPALRRAR